MGYIRVKTIVKTGGDGKNLATALAKNAMSRMPGCGMQITPYREADGRYRTGLDENAIYINKLSKDEQPIERARVKKLREELEQITHLDLSPTSDFYSKVYDNQDGVIQTATPVKISDKDLIFDEDKPEEAICAAWVRVYPLIARSLADLQGSSVAYISDPKSETEAAYSSEMAINKALTTLNALTAPQLRRMGRLMELPVNEDSSQEEAYMMINRILKKGTIDFGAYKNRKSVSVFNDLSDMTEATLSIKDLVKQAIKLSIYRKNKAGVIMQGENQIAESEEDLIAQIAGSTEERASLEKRIKSKQKLTA